MPHNVIHNTATTAISTLGGTLLAVIAIPATTFLTTIIIASVGATTSFVVTILLKLLYNRIFNKKKND
jgi:purine-cytosine permease-like protein